MLVETMMSRSLRLMFSSGVALSIGMLAQPAFAQAIETTTQPAQTSQKANASTESAVQRVEITGSNINRAETQTPSPVQIITAEELKKSGYTSVAQVLSNITANGQGTLNQAFSGSFAGGASGISLRGLTTSATLVLIDGHRMASYPLSDDNQRSFVDVSNIPFDIVERIEILKDGASAIYGSDAIAGVINVILKKSLVGTKVNVEGGATTAGGGKALHMSVSHGFGDLDTDGYNAYGAIEYRHEDKILESQRTGKGDWIRKDWKDVGGRDWTSGSTFFANPATLGQVYLVNPSNSQTRAFYPGGSCTEAMLAANNCKFVRPWSEITPETSNLNVLASFSKKLNDGWKVDVKGSMFKSEAESASSPLRTNMAYTGGRSVNPIIKVANGVPVSIGTPGLPPLKLPANNPYNLLGVDAYVNGVIPGGTPPISKFDSTAWRLVADLTGTFAEWDIKTSVGFTKIQTDQTRSGLTDAVALQNAFNNGMNPNAPTSSELAAIFRTASATAVSKLMFAELNATRPIFALAGGDFVLSTGASFIRTELDARAPELVAKGILGGNNAYVLGKQSNTALYAEFAAPVTKTLEIDGAIRYDHYDTGIGNSLVPKVAFKWTPNSVIGVRGTYSQGFRAPNAAESGQAGSTYLYGNTNDPKLCPGEGEAAGDVASTCAINPPYFQFSNSALSPEKSKSTTFGFILEPVKGWVSTLDFYQIKVSNQIVSVPEDISNAVRDSDKFPQDCSDGNGGVETCTPSVGRIIYIPAGYQNASSVKTSGFELGSRYKFNLGGLGNVTADLDWSHMTSYVLAMSGDSYELAGTHGPTIVGGATGSPKDRVQASFTYDKNALSVTTTFNWIGSMSITDPSGHIDTCNDGGQYWGWFTGDVPSQYCKVPSFLDVDLTVRYKVNKDMMVHLNVLNLFDKQAPVDFGTYGGGQFPFNPSMHIAGAIGRNINLGLNYKF
jgi:iron complex outermembrane receptor protein